VTREERYESEALVHLRSLHRTAYRMTGNAADAEDLVQETCLRAFRAFDTYTPGTNIRAWLYTILYRVRTDSFRKAGRQPQTVELVDDGPGVPPPQEALASGQEDLERALEELSYDEIAQVLRVPIGTVMSRIHRGRAQLRAALSGERT
jgi:RNA polymerase sigma-70 factor (ECF subfamily)